MNPPINLKVPSIIPGMAEMAVLLPRSKRVDGRMVSFDSKVLLEVYKIFRTMITLAGTIV